MRLRTNSRSTRIGNVDIYDLFQVLELDGGYTVSQDQHPTLHNDAFNGSGSHGSVNFSYSALYAIETQLTIVVLCMNEEQQIFEGVLRGIPRHYLIVLVSNSVLTKF